jgi:hypothetical protein
MSNQGLCVTAPQECKYAAVLNQQITDLEKTVVELKQEIRMSREVLQEVRTQLAVQKVRTGLIGTISAIVVAVVFGAFKMWEGK